jgi:hypothetical protein
MRIESCIWWIFFLKHLSRELYCSQTYIYKEIVLTFFTHINTYSSKITRTATKHSSGDEQNDAHTFFCEKSNNSRNKNDFSESFCQVHISTIDENA